MNGIYRGVGSTHPCWFSGCTLMLFTTLSNMSLATVSDFTQFTTVTFISTVIWIYVKEKVASSHYFHCENGAQWKWDIQFFSRTKESNTYRGLAA